jgi:hypothetical protein
MFGAMFDDEGAGRLKNLMAVSPTGTPFRNLICLATGRIAVFASRRIA